MEPHETTETTQDTEETGLDYARHNFRQSEFLSASLLARPAYLIGAGGIGSPTALILSKMGFHDLTVFDPDEVEPHNVGSQLYHADQQEDHKVYALQRFVERMNAISCSFPPDGWQTDPLAIVVSAVDSMDSRRAIWDYVKTQKLVSLYVDARMGLEVVRVYAIDPTDAEQAAFYEDSLHPEEEGEHLECSAKAVAYNGFFAASVVGGLVSAYLRQAPYPLETIGDMAEFRLAPTGPLANSNG